MNGEEIGVEQARKILGHLANDARDTGQITFLTYNGRRIAAIVPRHIAEQALNHNSQEKS
ncbi:hypothetical protein ACQEUU_37370 [Nonomuraea sp. CA-218870]|uniref:hypothetical protein n=1 Tax=Nonomuraea sp. CA-218870 TaxID=3239998 RepID=UPI003D8B391B